ncbi:MAG TPA: hypothetical protein VHR84_15355 [Terriglobales bacterium]|jgi:hypothetical protein|nr:hypothetical protein [Terriglobales bacterium]
MAIVFASLPDKRLLAFREIVSNEGVAAWFDPLQITPYRDRRMDGGACG